jgi:hypothetical protein
MKFKHALWGLALGGLAGALIAPGPARADDPLDDVDGTEGWDQVVQPERKVERRQQRRPDRQAIQREIAQWETIRVVWEQVREHYMLEKARHKKLASEMRSVPTPRTAVEINDDNIDQVTADDDGWGDAPGEQWLVPNSSVDRAIDDELEESRSARPSPQPAPQPPADTPAASPAPAAVQPPPAPTALTPPELESSAGDDLPDSFSQHKSEQRASGGLAPTAADPEAPMPPAPPQPARAQPAGSGDADRGAAAAAEMLERQQEQERQRREQEEARRQAEAEAGAAAAARLLEQQEEQRRREQEALRRKAGVEVDEDGQVVDPELRREIEAEDDQ